MILYSDNGTRIAYFYKKLTMNNSKVYFFSACCIALLFASCTPEDDGPQPTDARDKFIASWTCNESSSLTGNNPPFTVHINKGTADDLVVIENFYGFGFQNKASAQISVNHIEIPVQILAGNTIEGNGNISGNNIIYLDYMVNDGTVIDTISATLTNPVR